MSFLTDAERAALEAALPGWLPQQRWFATKGEAVGWAALHTVWPLTSTYALAWVDALGYASGRAYRYTLPLGLGASPNGCPALLPTVYDAARDPAFWTAFLAALSLPGPHTTGSFLIQRNAEGPAAAAALAHVSEASVSVITADHSNAAALVGEMFVRLTRRLNLDGPSPEAAALRLLDGLRLAPTLVANVTLHEPVRPSFATLAIVTEAFASPVSAWDVALQHLATRSLEEFVLLAQHLGATICRMHRALEASPKRAGFANEDVKDLVSDVFITLQVEVPEERILGVLSQLVPASPSTALGGKIPVHGDLHLGQVLVLPDETLRVIDFEGEPARTAEERARPDSPLRDVAGMLRSFDYAVCTALSEAERGAYRDAAERAFLDAYRAEAEAHPVRVLWPDDEAFDALLRLYLVQKTLYEIQYERAYRPDWAWIPEQALERLLAPPEGGLDNLSGSRT
ncbi:MAG: phosphotransferase [Rhodothermales bacterium]|nr:phosphotransferase [Rhodothermales bacterium]